MVTPRFRRISRDIVWPVSASVDFDKGDLLWYDSSAGCVKPMSDFTWDTNEQTTTRNALPKFVGIAPESRTGRESHASTMLVPSAAIALMPLDTGTTINVGDLVGFKQNSTPNGLLDQQVKKVTDIQNAIGYVVREGTTATEAEIAYFSWYDAELPLPARVRCHSWYLSQASLDVAGNVVTGFSFGQRVRLLKVQAILDVVPNADTTLNLEKNGSNIQVSTTDVDVVLQAAGAIGDIEAATAALLGADSSADIFEHDDLLDIESDGAASVSGACNLELYYMPWPDVA